MASKERADHIINAPYLDFDIPAQILKLRAEEQWRVEDRNAITLLKNSELCVVLITLHKGARMEEHRIDAPLTLLVLEGVIRFGLQGEWKDQPAHSLLTLHRGVSHDLQASQDSSILLSIFYTPDSAACAI